MFIINIIEVSSNGRGKLLEEPIKTNLPFNSKKEMEQYRKELTQQKTIEHKDDNINIYLCYTEK